MNNNAIMGERLGRAVQCDLVDERGWHGEHPGKKSERAKGDYS